MLAGKPYHRENFEIHTILSKKMLHETGKDSEDITWFTDLVTPHELTSMGMANADSNLLHLADVFSHAKAIEMAGRPNFVALTEGLMLGFLLTDLDGTTAADVNMPLPSFVIEVPPGTIYTHDNQTGWHETKYFIVSEGTSPLSGDNIFIYSWSAPNENSADLFDDHAEYFPLNMSVENESLSSVIASSEKIRLREVGILRGVFKSDSKGRIFGEIYKGADFREKLLRIIVNTIIYMTSASAVVEHEDQQEIDRLRNIQKRRGKLKIKDRKRLEDLEHNQHWMLGTDIKITHKDLEDFESARKSDQQDKRLGRKLQHPSLTRGHWRWQPYGTGRKLRKRIWIKPYIRGKELGGPTTSHTYKLEENKFGMY